MNENSKQIENCELENSFTVDAKNSLKPNTLENMDYDTMKKTMHMKCYILFQNKQFTFI